MTDIIAISLISLSAVKNIVTILDTFKHIWEYSQPKAAHFGSELINENTRVVLVIASRKLNRWRRFWGIQDGDDDTILVALWGRSAVNSVRNLLLSVHQDATAIDKNVSIISTLLQTQQKASFATKLGIRGPSNTASRRKYLPVRASETSYGLQDAAHEIQKRITNLCSNVQSLEPLSEIAFRVRHGPISSIDDNNNNNNNEDLGPSFSRLSYKRSQLHGFVDLCQVKDFALDLQLFNYGWQTESNAMPPVQATHILLVIENTSQATGDVSRCFLVREGSNDLPEETTKCLAGASTPADIISLLQSRDSRQKPADQCSKFVMQHDEKTYVIEERIIETSSGAKEHCSTYNFAQIPLMETGVPLTTYEKIQVACSLADHALLLLGSAWASCFTAINLRRQCSSYSQSKWTLHVHDSLADISHLKPLPYFLIQNQIMDLGFLLIGLALGRRFEANGSDMMTAVADVLPEVEMSIGHRFHNACLFCLTYGSAQTKMYMPKDENLAPPAILRVFFLEVCTPLQAVKEALSYNNDPRQAPSC